MKIVLTLPDGTTKEWDLGDGSMVDWMMMMFEIKRFIYGALPPPPVLYYLEHERGHEVPPPYDTAALQKKAE